jgi:putative holliday junction resolvase
MRLLGVDFGFKRIGLAVAETEPQIITARATIEASGTLKIDAEKLAVIAKREEVDTVVVGLPIEESGEEGKMARICRRLGGLLADHGVEVCFVDESYSSLEAERNLRLDHQGQDAPDTHALEGHGTVLKASQIRKLKDGEAARLILERFIAEGPAPCPAAPLDP